MQPRVASGISNQDTWNKSVNNTLAANVSPGNGLTFAASDGTPLTYSQDNMSGIIIRVGSTANPNGLTYAWPGVMVNLTITHNLGKVPYGFILIASYDVANLTWGTIPPTSSQITLQCSSTLTDTTIWLLA